MDIMMKSTGAVLVALLCSTAAQAAESAWVSLVAGNWSTEANWSNSVPNAAGDIAWLTNKPTAAAITITLDSPVTLGKLTMGSTKGFKIASGTLTFNNNGAGASVTQVGGAKNTIDSSVVLNDNLAITNTSATKEFTIGSAGGLGKISGNGAITVDGGFGVILGGSNSFTGGLTLDSGLLRTANAGVGADPTIGCNLGAGTLILNGGELSLENQQPLRRYGNDTTIAGDATIRSSKIGPSANTSTRQGLGILSIGSKTLTVKDSASMLAGQRTVLEFTGATISGASVLDVQASSNASSTNNLELGTLNGTGSITKNGAGGLVLDGAAGTFAGNISIAAGDLLATTNSGLLFVIGADGVNNTIDGTGAAVFDGQFVFDTTGAGTTLGDSWQIVDVDNLMETFATNFTVAGFTDAGSDKWTKAIDGTKSYEFSETTGVLMVVSNIPLTQATLHIAYSGGSVVVGSTNMASGFAHTLQVKNDLVYGTWSNVSTVVGVTSTNWTFSPVSAGFYRIESN